jgi:hypothetical protein
MQKKKSDSIERKFFMLGMITAFAECLASEAKRLALSPPFYPKDLESIRAETESIAGEQGIFLYLDENPDLPVPGRLYWYAMYKFPDAFEEYRHLRRRGYNPALHFDKFSALLSYGMVWGDGADKVTPRWREKRATRDTVARLLLNPGDWPIESGARRTGQGTRKGIRPSKRS